MTQITSWYYVVYDNTILNQVIADTLEEGSNSILLRPSRNRAEEWVAYTLRSPGDGSRYFQAIGRWDKTTGLKVSKEIFPKESTNFWGRKLLLGVVNKPRVLELSEEDENGFKVPLRGYSKDILDILKVHLNFTFRCKEYHIWGLPGPDGKFDGVIGDLISKKLDFSPMDFTPTKESREVIDFTEWLCEDPIVITSRAPQPVIKPFLLLEIFTLRFYLVLLFVLTTSGLLMWIFMMSTKRLMPGVFPVSKKNKLKDYIFSSLKSIVAQNVDYPPRDFTTQIFFVTVLYMTLIIDAVYQGNITAFIAMPRYSRPIDSYMDLLKNRRLIPATEELTVTETTFKESERESFKKIAARLEVYPDEFLDSEEFFDGVARGKWAFVDTWSSAYGRSLNFEAPRSRCKFYVSREIIIGGLDAWPFPRNSPIHSQISSSIKWMRYFGIIEYIKSKSYLTTCEQSTGLGAVDDPRKMGLNSMQGVFFVLCIGWSLAATSFILEIIVYQILSCCQ